MKKICYFILLFLAIGTMATAQSDSILLLELFNALKGSQWSDTTYRWNPSKPVSTWKGVVLDDEGKIVIDLDGVLDGAGTSLTGDIITPGVGIPQGIPLYLPLSLPDRLKVLSLGCNKADIRIDRLLYGAQLETINLNRNAITALPDSFPFLRNLDGFYAANNRIEGRIPLFPNSPNLRELELRKNRLSGPIPDFKDNPALVSISLRGNKFDLPVPSYPVNGQFLFLMENAFTFEDLWQTYDNNKAYNGTMQYFGQDSVPVPPLWNLGLGLPGNIDIGVDKNVPHPLVYTWYKKGQSTPFGETSSSVRSFPTVAPQDSGLYWCHIRNKTMTEDTLETLPFRIVVCSPTIQNIDTLLCPGQTLTVRGVRYDQNTPQGQIIVPQVATSNGCDSVYNVRLRFRGILSEYQIVCSAEEVDLAVFSAGAGGRWRTDKGALIENPEAFHTQVSHFGEGRNLFFWEQQVPSCPNGFSDTVSVYYDVPPKAKPDVYTVFTGKTGEAVVTENDQFDQGDMATVQTPPKHGTLLQFELDGTMRYTPDERFRGRDTLVYRVCPPKCPENFCDTALVVFLVVPEQTPAVITPNGDGINDAFVVKSLTPDVGVLPHNRLLVVDEWGSAVFNSSPYQNDWIGTNNYGKKLPEATYYYFFWSEYGSALTESGRVAIIY